MALKDKIPCGGFKYDPNTLHFQNAGKEIAVGAQLIYADEPENAQADLGEAYFVNNIFLNAAVIGDDPIECAVEVNGLELNSKDITFRVERKNDPTVLLPHADVTMYSSGLPGGSTSIATCKDRELHVHLPKGMWHEEDGQITSFSVYQVGTQSGGESGGGAVVVNVTGPTTTLDASTGEKMEKAAQNGGNIVLIDASGKIIFSGTLHSSVDGNGFVGFSINDLDFGDSGNVNNSKMKAMKVEFVHTTSGRPPLVQERYTLTTNYIEQIFNVDINIQ